MNLWGERAEERLAEDHGDPSGDAPDEGPVERTIDSFVVDEETPTGENSKLYLQLTAVDPLKFEYDVSISVEPPCRALQEDSEDNDSRADGAALEAGQHQMQLCAGDEDWVRVDVDRGDSLFVDIRPMQARGASGGDGATTDAGDLAVETVDAETGAPAAAARRDGPFWTAGIQGSRSDRALAVRVTGDGGEIETPYRVDVYEYAPCMEGDDRYEENDTLREASKLKQKLRHHRYLRICPRDDDFYTLEPKKHQSSSGGSKGGGGRPAGGAKSPLRVGLQKVPRAPDVDPEVELTALDPTSGDVRARGGQPEGDTDAREDGDDEETGGDGAAKRLDLLVETQRPDRGESVALHARGDSTFYHLVELPSRGGGSRNKQDNDGSQNKNQQTNRQRQNNQKRNKNSQDDSKSRKSDGKRKNRGRQKQRKSEQKPEDRDRKTKRKSGSKRESESDSEKRARDILDALENSDKNYQMQKALEENRQNGAVEKDW